MPRRDAGDTGERGGEGSEDDAGAEDGDVSDRGEDASGWEGDPGDSALEPLGVTLRFRGKVGALDYGCDRSYPEQGTSRTRVTGRAFRLFVSNVRMIARDGSEAPLALDERMPDQCPELSLLDFQNPDGSCGEQPTNTLVTGHVPAGDYRGVVFTVGVPEEINHGDPALASAPLRGSGMSWGWLQGYRFFVAELANVNPLDAGTGDGGLGPHDFEPGLGLLHVGSTGCVGSPASGIACTKRNRPEVRLPEFDPESQVIVADLAAMFSALDFEQGLQCHARGDFCAPMLSALGIDLLTGAALPAQSVFRVE